MSSFFKKPAWAQAKTSAKPTEFYRRSNQVYSDFVAAANDEEDSDDEINEKPETKYQPNESKRRRISTEDAPAVTSGPESSHKTPPQEDADGVTAEDPIPKPESTIRRTPPGRSRAAFTSPRRTSPRKNSPRKSPLKSASPPGTVIRLNSESPPPAAVRVPPTITLKDDSELDNDGDNDDESDEECAELVRRARERARNRSARAASKSKSPTGKPTAQLGQPNKKAGSPSKTVMAPKSPKKEETDTIVTILITSEIENTKPLLVRRKLSQNLGDVRKAWCSHQRFPEEIADTIILTWKGRRLFDATTCKSLGINDLENNDNAMFPGSDDGPFGVEEGSAGVHMQAMTSDSFEAERRRIANSLQDRGRESSEEEPQVQAPPEGGIVRITLKNPDLDDFKIKVRPSTRTINIINKYREMNGLSEDKTVSFFFDGDRLDPESLIGDNDIDDLDCIDVVLK
ncbi:hypothetical protein FQN49_002902 [Arthroderma sp. PD_2]|nr:hypothetical protein FQN49_002902 [Arthroderma sp. PD_2]